MYHALGLDWFLGDFGGFSDSKVSNDVAEVNR
jgi:hypothetical protein